MHAREILEACLYAPDLEAVEAFYVGVLGLEPIGRVEGRHVFFRCGARVFLVFDPAATIGGERVPGHGAHGPGHVAFAVTAGGLGGGGAQLEGKGGGVEREDGGPGGGQAHYIRDPAGNSVELGTPAIWAIDEGEVFG